MLFDQHHQARNNRILAYQDSLHLNPSVRECSHEHANAFNSLFSRLLTCSDCHDPSFFRRQQRKSLPAHVVDDYLVHHAQARVRDMSWLLEVT